MSAKCKANLIICVVICVRDRIVQVIFPSVLYYFVIGQHDMIYHGDCEIFPLSTSFLCTSLQHMKQFYSKSRKQNTKMQIKGTNPNQVISDQLTIP
jgi:hypothetical protein